MAEPLKGYEKVWVGSPNYSAGRKLPIDHVTVHHCAGFSLPDATFANPARQASSTYAVHGKTIHQYVAEGDTPWTDGNWYSNNSGITLELVNFASTPDWKIAEDTFDTAARLVADILQRHKLGKLSYNGSKDGSTLYRHCDLSATGCPGPWFIANTDRFIELTNKYLIGHDPAPLPTLSQTVWMYTPNGTAAQKWLVKKQVDGTYEIRATTPAARCLDVRDGKVVLGNPVQLYQKNDTPAQRWILETVLDERTALTRIRPRGNIKLALDVIGGAILPMSSLQVYVDNKTAAQGWVFIPTEKKDVYIIANQLTGLVLDAAGGE